MPQRRGTQPSSPPSAGPAPLPPGAPVDVRVVRARVEGRAVLAPAADPSLPPAPSNGGLLVVPLWLLAGTGPVAWLGSRPNGSGWAAVVAAAVCLATARGWVVAERRTARVDERVRATFAPGVSTTVVLPDTDAARAAADEDATPGDDAAQDDTEAVDADAPDADDAEGRRSPTAAAARFAARTAEAGRTTSLVAGRLGRASTVLAAAVAVALAVLTVCAVAALLARPGALELLALAGPPALLVVHLRLLVGRASVPVVGEGFLARWADAALIARDLRVRLASGAAAPALYVVAWQRWDTWWSGVAVAAVAVLLAVQVAVLAGLGRDRDRLPGLAVPDAPRVVDLTAAETSVATGPR